MPDSINQVHGFPRLANGPALPSFIRRGSILDGSVYAFPGPGQVPYSADGGDGDAYPYAPPDDWVPENYSLRRPQVVWCSLSPASDFPDDASDALYDTVFPDLKGLIEAAHPGLTWVYIPNWHSQPFEDYTKDFWGGDPPPPGLDAAFTTKLYSAHAGPTMTSPFFGTNFLHLSFGVAYEPYLGPLVELLQNGTPLDEDETFQLGLFWIPLFSQIMSGWAVYSWFYDSEFAEFRQPVVEAFAQESTVVNPNFVYQGDAGGSPSSPPEVDANDLAVLVAQYYGFPL
jgi:hypothetical protein